MARKTRLVHPPASGSHELDSWLADVWSTVNDLPNFSIQSFSGGPESNYTADPGTILLDVGSSVTKAWVKQSGSTNVGWIALDNA